MRLALLSWLFKKKTVKCNHQRVIAQDKTSGIHVILVQNKSLYLKIGFCIIFIILQKLQLDIGALMIYKVSKLCMFPYTFNTYTCF